MNNGYQCEVEELSESNPSMEYTEMSKVVFDSGIATSSVYNPCSNSALEYTVANENISNEELRNVDVDKEEEWKRMKRKEEMIAEKRRIHNEKRRSRYEGMPDEEKQAYIRRRERDNAAHKARYHAMNPEERRSHYAKKRKKLDNAARERLNAAHRARYQAMTPEERTIFNRTMRIGSREKGNASRRTKYHAMTPEERRIRNAKNRKKSSINDEDKEGNVSEVESQDEKKICNEKPREHIDGHPQSVEIEDQEKRLEEEGPSKELVHNGQLLPTPTKPRQNILENEKYIEAIRARLQAMTRKERRIFIRKRTQEHIDYHQNEISNLKKTEEIRTQNESFTSNKSDEQHDPSNVLGVFSDIQKEVIQQSVKAKDRQEEERTLLETLNVAEPYSDGGSITSSENRLLKFADLTLNVLPKTGAKSKPNLDKGQLAQRERARKDKENAAQRARYQAMTPEERTIYNKKWRDSRKEKGNAARRAKYQAMTPEERRSRRTRQTAEERRIHNEKARMKYPEVKDVRKKQRMNNERAIARYEQHKAALRAKYQAMTPEERRSRYAKNRKKPTIEDEDKKRNVTNGGSQNEKEICNEKPPEHIDHHEQLQPEKMIDATTQENTAANKFRLCSFFPLTISYDN